MKRKILISLLCLLLAASTLLSASCTIRLKAAELTAGYTRKTDDAGELTEEARTALLSFSLSLFRKTAAAPESSENRLFSPLSALLCLGLLLNGTGGVSRTEAETVLGIPVETLNRGLYAYANRLYNGKDSVLRTANSAWILDDPDRIEVRPSYLQTITDWYDAELFSTPFDATTLKDINAWGRDKTEGMIPSFLDELDPEALMILVNALVFDAKWENTYEKNDILDRQTFRNADGTETSVTMLASTESTYLEGNGFTGFLRPYKGGHYAFLALLPDEGTDLCEAAGALNAESWTALWESRGGSVEVRIPEFTVRSHLKLKDALISLGLESIWGENADFTEIDDRHPLYCDGVEQMTFLELDRNGTKAAAITWSIVKGEAAFAEVRRVYLDRPFLYAIVDTESGFPIFLGTVLGL